MLMLMLMFMTAPTLAVDEAAGESAIAQSPLDARQYRAMVLPNGLRVLLVSDPATDKAAAALDVGVGSGSDPADWQGLAHLLEHVLFLGSEKYPDAGEYRNFIGDHGGDNNAYTSFSHTNYYFEVSAEHLRPALDRFSRFFIDPSFDETFIARERAVVHSEFQSRRKDEGRRLWSARRQLVNAAHPGSQFSVGSEYTLRDRGGTDGQHTLRQQLLDFYARHYSADLMTLAVVGRESVHELANMARQLFSAVPDREAEAALFTQPYFSPAHAASRLDVTPEKTHTAVAFLFPMPSVEAHYRAKPLSYIANLVGHEGEGSLLALLKTLGWAEGLSAGAGFMDKAQGVFEVSVQLTAPGLAHIDDIGALLFQYIALLENDGVAAWRFDEQMRLANIAFRFAPATGAGAVARHLAASMHRYPSVDVLRGPYRMDEYRPALIRDLLAQLQPDDILMQVVAKHDEFGGGDGKVAGSDASKNYENSAANVDRNSDQNIIELAPDPATLATPLQCGKTPFYDVDFALSKIAPGALERWRLARGGQARRDPRLALPLANPFIPERLAAQVEAADDAAPQRLDTPAVLAGLEAWRLGGAMFGAPRAVFYVGVDSPLVDDSARHVVLSELFVRLVAQRLDKIGYPARLAGLDYQIYRRARGFSVRIHGYEDQLPALLAAILSALTAPRFEAERLALASAELQRELRNNALNSPSQQAVHEIYRLLLHPHWRDAERLAALEGLEVADLNAHAARLLGAVKLTSLSEGDVAIERSLRMNQMLGEAFAGAQFIDKAPPPKVFMLDDGIAYVRSLNVAHDDSALAIYFQGRENSDRERARMALLGRLLEAPFFFNLRTTHRVGYSVYATSLDLWGVPGLLLSAQSPSHGPQQIYRLSAAFLDEFDGVLAAMPAAEFAQIKRGLIDRIVQRDKTLAERAARHWQEINLKKHDFAARQRLAEQVENLDQAAMLDYFRAALLGDDSRQLLVQSLSQRVDSPADLSADSAVDSALDSPHEARRAIAGEGYRMLSSAADFRHAGRAFFPAP